MVEDHCCPRCLRSRQLPFRNQGLFLDLVLDLCLSQPLPRGNGPSSSTDPSSTFSRSSSSTNSPNISHNDSLWDPLHTKEGDEISMFWGPCLQSSISRLSFSFLALFFAVQLALVSMITITPTLSLSVFSLQRTRLFRTSGELWRTRGELWLYFEMQRRLDLWSFSWSSRRSREAQKRAQLAFRDRSIDYRTDPRR